MTESGGPGSMAAMTTDGPASRIFLLALAVGLFAAGRPAGAAITVGAWAPIFQGVEFAQGEADASEPRLQKVCAVRVNLQARGIQLFSTPAGGTAPMETMSETTGEFLAHHRLQLAINANFYAPCCTPGEKDLLGLAMSRGTVVSPPVTTGTGSAALVVTRDNHATITKTTAGFTTQNYWTAIAGTEIVLTGGAKTTLADSEFNKTPHPRTAVGLAQGGRYLILLIIDGRQPGYSMGATTEEVAEWLQRFGASEGLNLDGGGSTTLVRELNGKPKVLNLPSGVALGSGENAGKSADEREQRSNGNNFGVFARLLPAAK